MTRKWGQAWGLGWRDVVGLGQGSLSWGRGGKAWRGREGLWWCGQQSKRSSEPWAHTDFKICPGLFFLALVTMCKDLEEGSILVPVCS